MSWTPLSKPQPAAGRRAAVALSMHPANRNVSASMTLTLRLLQLDDLDLVQLGVGIKAMLGAGEHDGLLRIEAGEDIRVGRPGGKRPAPDLVTIRLPVPPGVAPTKQKPVPVEHDYAQDWLEITLPAWARPVLAAPVPPSIAGARAGRDQVMGRLAQGSPA